MPLAALHYIWVWGVCLNSLGIQVHHSTVTEINGKPEEPLLLQTQRWSFQQHHPLLVPAVSVGALSS